MNRRANIPLLGGLGVALGFYAAIAVAIGREDPGAHDRGNLEGQLIGSLILLALGVLDDRRALSARAKLVVQIAAAAIAIAYGFRIDRLFVETRTALAKHLDPQPIGALHDQLREAIEAAKENSDAAPAASNAKDHGGAKPTG